MLVYISNNLAVLFVCLVRVAVRSTCLPHNVPTSYKYETVLQLPFIIFISMYVISWLDS